MFKNFTKFNKKLIIKRTITTEIKLGVVGSGQMVLKF
jgi:hypothetical protein